MAEINLTDITKETFGSRLPNVFIQQITIDYHENVDSLSEEVVNGSADITALLNLKFTKPAYLQHSSVQAFIRTHLSGLYLYAFLPFAESIKIKLENDNLSMREFLEFESAYIAEHYRDKNSYKIPLSTLIKEVDSDSEDDETEEINVYNSKLITNSSFDSEGNEIIEISNITINFTAGLAAGSPSIDDIPSLMIMATVGYETGHIISDRFDDYFEAPYELPLRFGIDATSAFEAEYVTSTVGPGVFNRHFGNITYYHLLEYGEVSPRFYQVYTTPGGAAYYDQVLQSLNGKFYATEGFSFEDLQARFTALIATYEEPRELDPTLNTNISDLEAIINATRNRTNVLGEIANYRSTYPNKQQSTNSGRFYSELIVVFSEVLESVHSQMELTSRMFFDSLVIDNRSSLLGSAWVPPVIPGGYEKQGTYTAPSDNYIPRAWYQMVRKAFLRDKGTSAALLAETYGSATISSSGMSLAETTAGPAADAVGASSSSDYGAYYKEFYDAYKAEGFSDEQASLLAQEEVDYVFSQSDTPTTVATDLLNPTLNDTNFLDFSAGDIVVKTTGHFFYDYEKAIRCTTEISKLLYVEKLQKYFRINIPYEYFYFNNIQMLRRELQLSVYGGVKAHDWVTPKIQTFFHQPADDVTGGSDYPRAKIGKVHYAIGNADGTDSDFGGNSRFKYGRPVVFIGGTRYSPFVRPRNWDLMIANRNKRLEGFNDLDSVSSWDDFGTGVQTVLDGYRLQCFQFQDFMDDDVAYYNTYGVDVLSNAGDRKDLMSRSDFNARGTESTVYKIKVTMEDLTMNSYCGFVTKAEEAYNNYLDYVAEARQICSYNNITNSYNQFFIDKINEKYTTKPWVRAAYWAVGISDMLFGASSAISEEAYRQAVIKEVMKIAPQTGNLNQTIEFARVFNTLLQYIAGTDPIEGAIEPPAGDEATPARVFGARSSTKKYINEVAITGPIYGDFAPDLEADDGLFDIRDTLPTPVVKRAYSKTSPDETVSSPYIDRSGTASSSEYDVIYTDISEEDKVKYIWERVFIQGRYSPIYHLLYFHGYPSADLTGELRSYITHRMNTSVYNGVDADELMTSGEHVYTGMNYFVHRIMRHFSQDLELNPSGVAAKRKPGGGTVAGLRNYRTLRQVLYVLETYMLPETNRRAYASSYTPGERYYKDSSIAEYMMDLAISTGSPYYDDDNIHGTLPALIKIVLEYIIDYIKARLPENTLGAGATSIADLLSGVTLPSPSGGGGGGMDLVVGDMIERDESEIYAVVSEENPWGSSDFNGALE